MDKSNGRPAKTIEKPAFVVLLEAEISSTLRYLLDINDITGGGDVMKTALMDKLNDLARSVHKWHSKAPAPGYSSESLPTTRPLP